MSVVSTDSILSLAADGFQFAKLIKRGPSKGQYIGMPEKRGSTHRVYANRAMPHIVTKNVPPGVVRIQYREGSTLDFTGPERKEQADAKLAEWKLIALNSVPYSAVTVPHGKSYKTFCAQRAAAASDGSLYDRNPNTAMSKKTAPKPPVKGAKTATASNRVSQNGMTLPAEGTTCRKVWDLADKHDGNRQAVLAECEKKGINGATATTQYGKWRVFNGLKGAPRAAKPVAEKKKAPKAPAKKKAPKAPAPVAVEAETTASE